MKKVHIFALSILYIFCCILFSACTSDIFAKTIFLSDYVEQGSIIELTASQKLAVKVEITPSDVTNNEFIAMVVDEDKTDLLSFEYDFDKMMLTLVATSDLGDEQSVTVDIKISAVKSNATFETKVKIFSQDSPEIQALSSPEISYDGNGNLIWTEIEGNNGYEIEIYANDLLVENNSTNFNLMALDLNSLSGKDIKAQVKAKGRTPDLDSNFSILQFFVLPAPNNLRFNIENQTVCWDSVENANGYNLKLGNRIIHSATNCFDATGYFDLAGTTNLSVMSVGSIDFSFISSSYTNQIGIVKLGEISSWTLENDILSWNEVNGATAYVIQISNSENIYEFESSTNSINLALRDLKVGENTIKVNSTSSQSYVINGDIKQYKVQKLAKVTGLKLENGKICWDSNASTYKIFIDGEFYGETKFANFDYSVIRSQMITEFNVVASGDNISKISSDLLFEESSPLKIYKLSTPDLIFDGNGLVSWESIDNASGYLLTLDENIEIPINKNSQNVSILNDNIDYSQPKNIEFKVKGNGDGIISLVDRAIYLDSDSIYRTATKLSKVNAQFGTYNGKNCLIWSGTNEGGYKIFVNDGENDFESEVIYQSYYDVQNFMTTEDIYFVKSYQARIVALSNQTNKNTWYFSSESSESVLVYKLPNVALSVNNGEINWNYGSIDYILGFEAYLTKGSQIISLNNFLTTDTHYDFKEQLAGTYTFSISAIGNPQSNYVSSKTSSITVTKLSKIQNVSITKTTTENFYSPLDMYTISFDDINNSHAEYICSIDDTVVGLTDQDGTYSVDIYGAQIADLMTINIKINGDNSSYISCDEFEFYLEKSDEPIVSTNSAGTAVKTNVTKYFGLLKIEGQDLADTFDGTREDEFVFDTNSQFKVKAVSFDNEQTVANKQSLKVDSLYSQVYKISKLAKPQLYVDEGVLKVKSTDTTPINSYYFNFRINGSNISADYDKFSNLNTYLNEGLGVCLVEGYFTDSNTGSMNDGILYLKSDVCSALSVKVLPTPESLYIRDGVVYVTFKEGTTIFGAKLAIYVDNADVTSDDNTQSSYEFAQNHTVAGEYHISAKVISKMSGMDQNTVYPLHGELKTGLIITKLKQVEDISVTSFVPEDDGTIANLVAGINVASNLLPNSLSNQTGFLRFKSVNKAIKYLIVDNDNLDKKLYVEASDEEYIYVNFQGTDFGGGINNITITAIGNQKEIVDSENSDQFTFKKLFTPQNVLITDGKITWSDINNPNNSDLSNNSFFGVYYPEWLINSDRNAIVYYALINGQYICTIDLSNISDFDDLSVLCSLTNELKDLSYDANLELNSVGVYTIQICATALNSYVDATFMDFILADNILTLSAKRTDNVYVNSDFSSPIRVSPITSPYSLTIDDKVLSWMTPYSDIASPESIALSSAGFEIKGYHLRVYKNGEILKFGENDYISISGASNTTWDFGSYLDSLSETEGNYSFEIKTIVSQKAGVSDPEIYYINSAYSLSFSTTALKTPKLGVFDGNIAWQMVNDSTGYAIDIDGNIYTTYEDAEMFKISEQMYVFTGNLQAGEHTVKLQATGGDEKYLVSSPFSESVVYTKLKPVTLFVDASSGMINFDVENQYKMNSDKWSYIVSIDGYDDVNNNHSTIFDLSTKGNSYVGGKIYSIVARAKNMGTYFVIANENDMILNADDSNVLVAYKLLAPSRFDVIDNYQSLTWSNRDNNVNNVSYVLSIAGNIIATNQQTKYSFDTSGEVNAEVFVHAIYSGIINIAGIDYYCLKSNANEYVNVHKLATPTNIRFTEGVLSWNRSLDDETHLIVVDNNEIINKDSYDFAEEEPGSYSVYLYNLVRENLRERTDTEIYLSSKNTDIYTVTKLNTPINFEICEKYNTADNLSMEYTFTFSSISNATNYLISVLDKNGMQKYQFKVPSSILEISNNLVLFKISTVTDYQLDNYINTSGYTLQNILDFMNSNNFSLQVKAIGNTVANISTNNMNFASSNINFILAERIAEADSITDVNDYILSSSSSLDETFTGKVEWNKVNVAEKYYIEIECVDNIDASEYVFINNAVLVYSNGNKKVYEITNTFIQFAHSGNYNIKVIAVPFDQDAMLQSNNSYKKSIQSNTTIFETLLSYSLFADGDGTLLNPYIVSNFEQFTCIKYNIFAHYKLNVNIDFNDGIEYGRKFGTINEFYGTIDGNNKKLTISYADNFAGIVYMLNEGAKISNLTIDGTITSIKSNETESIVGGIAGINYGTITNCLNKLAITGNGLILSTVGGIAGINYGTITRSGNLGNLNGNFVGGIAGKMFGNLISECYNGVDGSLTINSTVCQLINGIDNFQSDTSLCFAGGIVGYQNSGEIKSCYSYSVIYATNSDGMAYIGGISGYLTGSCSIKNCYVIDQKNRYTGIRLLDAKERNTLKVGILIGFIESDNVTIQHCAASYNSALNIEEIQTLYAVGNGYDGDGITGVIKNGSEYQYIYEVVSENNNGVYQANNNNYCTLANAKYDL